MIEVQPHVFRPAINKWYPKDKRIQDSKVGNSLIKSEVEWSQKITDEVGITIIWALRLGVPMGFVAIIIEALKLLYHS